MDPMALWLAVLHGLEPLGWLPIEANEFSCGSYGFVVTTSAWPRVKSLPESSIAFTLQLSTLIALWEFWTLEAPLCLPVETNSFSNGSYGFMVSNSAWTTVEPLGLLPIEASSFSYGSHCFVVSTSAWPRVRHSLHFTIVYLNETYLPLMLLLLGCYTGYHSHLVWLSLNPLGERAVGI